MALLSTLLDTFNTAGAIDGTKWTFSNSGLSGAATYAAGRLKFDAQTNVALSSECHLLSLASYDLTASNAFIELISRSHPTGAEVGMRVQSSTDATDWVGFYVSTDGLLHLSGFVNGVEQVGTSFTFNATTHAWWRVRESGGVILWDTASLTSGNPPASGDWINRFSATVSSLGWDITSVKAHIYMSNTTATTGNPTSEWDGFNTSAGTGSGTTTGTFAAVESGADRFAGSATLKVAATLTATETGTDTFQSSVGTLAARAATIAIVETGSDQMRMTLIRQLGVPLPPYNPPVTNDDFLAWLKKPDSVKCLLIEVDVLISDFPATLYLSSVGYVTGPNEQPSNTIYTSHIIGGCTVDSEISLDYTSSLTLGDVEISNVDGVHDNWFNFTWQNRPIRFYIGDVRWKRADFRLVFTGVCHDVAARDYNKINIVLSDKLQRLNQSVTSNVLGGSTENKDKLLPLCFGEVSNITPLLMDPVTLTYKVHDGAIQELVEVRDEGVPITSNVVTGPSNGTFRLTATPAGRITCTVRGDKFTNGYASTVSQIVQRLVTGFGTAPFALADIDLLNFQQFDADNPQPVGIYLQERENILDVCNLLCASVGAALSMGADGKLRLTKIQGLNPFDIPQTNVTPSHFLAGTFELLERTDVQPAIKLGYNRNWTPEPDLQSGIPPDHKAMWADEWLTITQFNAASCIRYGLPQQPANQTDTYLIQSNDAAAEASRRIFLWGNPRTIYGYEGFGELLLQQLGDWQKITHFRFGFANGVPGLILGLEKDFLNFKTKVRVLV